MMYYNLQYLVGQQMREKLFLHLPMVSPQWGEILDRMVRVDIQNVSLKDVIQQKRLIHLGKIVEKDFDYVFYLACRYNHLEIIRLMIEKGANDWNGGLRGACLEQNLKIVDLMIKKGANDWNGGLYYACLNGNLEIVRLMMEKGANNWNWGLFGSRHGGNTEIVMLMIEKGATDIQYCIDHCTTPKYIKNYLSKLIIKPKKN